jgi:plastocyanin
MVRRTTVLAVVCVSAVLSSCGGGGTSADAGPSLNNCHDSDYVDISSMAMPTVMFSGMAYTPRCATIHVGQSVTFSGSFGTHPLMPGHAPNNTDPIGAPNSPIMATASGMTATFMFTAAGDYPFYCANHYPAGMSGVIRVQ